MNFYCFLQSNPLVLLSLIVVIGFIIGRIRIFGFSFETSTILLVAMAFGNYGFSLPEEFQTLGLILFIYAIGLQAGPSIFNLGKKESFQLNGIVLALISFSALFTTLLAKIFSLDMALAIGLFVGALTSTPGLAIASNMSESQRPLVLLATVYPFAMILMIVWSKIMAFF